MLMFRPHLIKQSKAIQCISILLALTQLVDANFIRNYAVLYGKKNSDAVVAVYANISTKSNLCLPEGCSKHYRQERAYSAEVD